MPSNLVLFDEEAEIVDLKVTAPLGKSDHAIVSAFNHMKRWYTRMARPIMMI